MTSGVFTKENAERLMLGKIPLAFLDEMRISGERKVGKGVEESVILSTADVIMKAEVMRPGPPMNGLQLRYWRDGDPNTGSRSRSDRVEYNLALRLGEDGRFKHSLLSPSTPYDGSGGVPKTINLERAQELTNDMNRLFEKSAKIREWFKKDTGLEWGVKRAGQLQEARRNKRNFS